MHKNYNLTLKSLPKSECSQPNINTSEKIQEETGYDSKTALKYDINAHYEFGITCQYS